MSDDATPEPSVNRGNAGKGRPKGSLNKVTLAAREAILLAAEGLGGVDGLIAWAQKDDENQRLFWTVIYPKVLPYGGGPDTNAAAAVTGALVWRMPEPDEAEAIAAADVEAEAAAAVGGAAVDEAAEAATAVADAGAATEVAKEAAAIEVADADAAAGPASLGATVVWKAPEPAGARGLPGLPGGTPEGGGTAPAPPAPPPKT